MLQVHTWIFITLILPFTKPEASDIYCTNLKTCFLIPILLIAVVVTLVCVTVKEERLVTLVCVTVKEERLDPSNWMQNKQGINGEEEAPSLFTQLGTAIRSISEPMKILYVITVCLINLIFIPKLIQNYAVVLSQS